MSIATNLDAFFKQTNDHVFIEAEGKPNVLASFLQQYNATHVPVFPTTDGIIQLQPNANKYGLELRLYLNHQQSFIHATHTSTYRGNYPYRINNNDVIKELLQMGYKIGLN